MTMKTKINAQMVLCGKNAETVADELGISKKTFYRKINNQNRWVYYEIMQLVDILNIKDPEAFFFPDSVAKRGNAANEQ